MPAAPLVIAIVTAAASVGTQIAGIQDAKNRASTAESNLKKQRELERVDQLREHRRLAGRQDVLFAKAGVDLTGTPLDVRAEAEMVLAENMRRLDSGFDARIDMVEAEENMAILAGSGNILATVGGTVGQLSALGAFDT